MTSVYDACVESDFCLFLGAGASKFAGYPMMKCLTEKVINVARNGIDGEGFACLEHFKRPEILKLDIESILSQQRDLLKIAELSISGYRLAGEDFKAIQNLGEKARVYSKEIVRAIYEAIRIENCKYDKVKKYYSQLLSALSESFSPFQMIPIITTNYDLIIESLEDIEDKEVNVYDGWRAGSAFKREWSFVGHKALEIEYNKQEFNIGLFKIHGSLNWFHSKKENKLVYQPEYSALDKKKYQPMILPPTFGKNEEIFGPITDGIFKNAKDVMWDKKHIIFAGFSFRDEHLNYGLFQLLNYSDTTITILDPFPKAIEEQVSKVFGSKLMKRLRVIEGKFGEDPAWIREAERLP